MPASIDLEALRGVIQQAKKVAQRYRQLTGKPLGITGEVGEFVAADLLHLHLTKARQAGYDAITPVRQQKIQIKARCVLPNSRKSQRIGRIRLDYEWHKVVLVLMDGCFSPMEIYQANREDVERELTRPGSKARNQQGQLSISSFKRIAGKPIWKRDVTE
jgi:hypothetical protein